MDENNTSENPVQPEQTSQPDVQSVATPTPQEFGAQAYPSFDQEPTTQPVAPETPDPVTAPALSSQDPVSTEPVPPVTAPNPFGAALNNELAKPISDVKPPEVPSSVAPETPAPQVDSPVVAPPKKKAKTGLWVTLGIIIVLLAALAGGYFFIKGNADRVADTYTNQVKVYLASVYTAVNSPTDSPSTVKDNVTKFTKPRLGDAQFNTLSTKYADAQKLDTNTTAKIAGLTAKLDEYAGFDAFQSVITDQTKVISAIPASGISTSITQISGALDKMKTATTGAVVPMDLQADLATYSTNLNKVITAATAVKTASDAKDTAGLATATASFETAFTSLSLPSSFKTYSSNLANDMSNAATDIKTFDDSIK